MNLLRKLFAHPVLAGLAMLAPWPAAGRATDIAPHRQVVDSGVATNIVLEHRASHASDPVAAKAPADKASKARR